MRIRFKILMIASITINMLPAMAQENLPVACAGSAVRYGVEGLSESVYEWTIIGGTIINNYNDSIDVLWGNEKGTYSLQVTEHSIYNCTGDPFLASIDIETPFVDIGDVVHVCEGDTELIVVSGAFKSYYWNNEQTSGPVYYASEPGLIWVEVTDQNDCINRDSAIVQIHDLPMVNLGVDQELCGDEKMVLDAGDDGVYYQWSTGSMTQTLTVIEGEQEYSVEVRNEYGCSSFDTVKILACLLYKQLQEQIPTAFTPSPKDGHNDYFYIDHIKLRFPEVEVEIFDRWGRRVFKSDVGYSEPWDGTYDGQELPMDSYYYVIDLKEGLQPIAGSVSIVR